MKILAAISFVGIARPERINRPRARAIDYMVIKNNPAKRRSRNYDNNHDKFLN